MTEQQKSDKPDWSDAVARAAEHVQERTVAADMVAERQKPKPRGPILVASAIVFVGVLGWDVFMMSRPPQALPPEEVAVDLRWLVADAAEQVEAFRSENGRLPTRAELGDLLAEGLEYELLDGAYLVSAEEAGVRIEYDGSVPLERWVAAP